MLVECRSTSVVFDEREIVHELSFVINSGDSVALVGPSGSGKSTILAMIAGYVRPSSGLMTCECRDSLSWIVQSSPLLDKRSVFDNVALGALATGSTRSDAYADASRYLALLKIDVHATKAAYRLSGGERQRVAVARALAARSRLVLADEPTASLDSASRELVIDALLYSADKAGSAVVVATHDPYVARKCSISIDLALPDAPSRP